MNYCISLSGLDWLTGFQQRKTANVELAFAHHNAVAFSSLYIHAKVKEVKGVEREGGKEGEREREREEEVKEEVREEGRRGGREGRGK